MTTHFWHAKIGRFAGPGTSLPEKSGHITRKKWSYRPEKAVISAADLQVRGSDRREEALPLI